MRDALSIFLRAILSLAASMFVLWLFALLVLFALGGCSNEGEKEEPVQGEQGEPGEDGQDGKDGKDGKNGAQGPAGRDGLDGRNGTDGIDGTSPELDIFPVIPCPTVTGAYPEVLLCIANELYAVYDGGPQKDRLVLVPPGDYQTTDGRSCQFTVTEACELED